MQLISDLKDLYVLVQKQMERGKSVFLYFTPTHGDDLHAGEKLDLYPFIEELS